MAHVAAIASDSAGADLAAVFLRVDGEARLRLAAGDGCPAGLVDTLELALGDGAPAALALERRASVSPPRSRRSGLGDDPLLEALPPGSRPHGPRRGADRRAAGRAPRRTGARRDRGRAVWHIADLAAVAVDRLRAAAESDRRRQETEALEAIGHELTSTLDHAVVLQRITDRARELAGGDFAFIAPLEAGGQAAVIAAVSGARTAAAMGLRMEPGLGVSGRVLATGKPFVTEHYLTDPRVSQEHAEIIVAEGWAPWPCCRCASGGRSPASWAWPAGPRASGPTRIFACSASSRTRRRWPSRMRACSGRRACARSGCGP